MKYSVMLCVLMCVEWVVEAVENVVYELVNEARDIKESIIDTLNFNERRINMKSIVAVLTMVGALMMGGCGGGVASSTLESVTESATYEDVSWEQVLSVIPAGEGSRLRVVTEGGTYEPFIDLNIVVGEVLEVWSVRRIADKTRVTLVVVIKVGDRASLSKIIVIP